MNRIALFLPLLGLLGTFEVRADDVLLVRYALFVGGREGVAAPASAGILSREGLTKVLIDWDPGSDNAEVRRVFALNHLGEVARQAVQLPLGGGPVRGAYPYRGASFEVRLGVSGVKDGTSDIAARILRNGRLLASPSLRQPLGERAILSSTGGPEAPFLFFVVEVNRVAAESLQRKDLELAWRRNATVVDGQRVRPPKLVKSVQPAYTPAAKRAGIGGDVVLQLLVGKTGNVDDVQVLKGLREGLTEAAVVAVRQWKYEPPIVDGRPAAVLLTITVHFEPI